MFGHIARLPADTPAPQAMLRKSISLPVVHQTTLGDVYLVVRVSYGQTNCVVTAAEYLSLLSGVELLVVVTRERRYVITTSHEVFYYLPYAPKVTGVYVFAGVGI